MLEYFRYTLLIALLLIGCANSREKGKENLAMLAINTEDSLSIHMDSVVRIDTLRICSFNIQFLGHFKDRENAILADLLSDYDLVVVQEMVAPPVKGQYPDGTHYKADVQSADFLEEMKKRNFSYWLSQEDTGPTKNHTSSSASEWWVVFYRADRCLPDSMNQHYGFLDTLRVANENYERVPYAFPFRSVNGELDFTLISVHLKPGGSSVDMQRRNEELRAINAWVQRNMVSDVNKDYYILGDCNIENRLELAALRDDPNFIEFQSLNDSCKATNTKYYESETKGKPYDHVFYNFSCKEDLINSSFEVVDIYKFLEMKGLKGEYAPYDHDVFRTRLSDHMPVTFKLLTTKDSD